MKVPVLANLIEWATLPSELPLAVLYGEAGSGKTVTSQAVTHTLREMRGSKAPKWAPHYFSLKYCVFAGSSVPTLEELLTESIRRHWESEGDLPTGKSLLRTAKTKPTLFIIDGFEWLANQLTDRRKQVLMHELFKLVPNRNASGKWQGPYAGDQAKVLLTLEPRYKRLVRMRYPSGTIKELLLGPL